MCWGYNQERTTLWTSSPRIYVLSAWTFVSWRHIINRNVLGSRQITFMRHLARMSADRSLRRLRNLQNVWVGQGGEKPLRIEPCRCCSSTLKGNSLLVQFIFCKLKHLRITKLVNRYIFKIYYYGDFLACYITSSMLTILLILSYFDICIFTSIQFVQTIEHWSAIWQPEVRVPGHH